MVIADAGHIEHVASQARLMSGTQLVQGFIAGHKRELWNDRISDALWYWEDTSIAQVELSNHLGQTDVWN